MHLRRPRSPLLFRAWRAARINRRSGAKVEDYQFFLYLDNTVTDVFLQVLPYFESGFLPRDRVLLVYRYHDENGARIEELATQAGVKVHAFAYLRDVPPFPRGICFYTHNTQSNLRVVANRRVKHVLLLHGESEKEASAKAISRIYDTLVVAGERAFDRYCAGGIFLPCERQRFVKMGEVVINSQIRPQVAPPTSRQQPAILYAPTWEGARVDENHSSLSLPEKVAGLLAALARQSGSKTVVVKLHPATGLREPAMLAQARRLLAALRQKHQLTVLAVKTPGSWLAKKLFPANDLGWVTTFSDLARVQEENFFAWALCDVSAMVMDAVVAHIPIVVLARDRAATRLPAQSIDLRELGQREPLDLVEGLDRSPIALESLAPEWLDYEEEALRTLSAGERFEWFVHRTLSEERSHGN